MPLIYMYFDIEGALYKLLENGVLSLKLAFVEKLQVMVAKTEFWVLKNTLLSSQNA